jgi:uncharacterized protein (TIGR03790 family)
VSIKRARFILLVLALVGPLPAADVPALGAARADKLAERVVLLANSRQPDSVRLAEFYAEKRGVPPANIIALPLPEAEDITWREFIDQVYQPLQDELFRRGWLEGTATSLLDRFGRKRYAFLGNRLSYLVVCRGVPLRIYNDPTLLGGNPGRKIPEILNKNESAVDSELSLIAQGSYEITAFVGNPLFNTEQPPTLDAQLIVKVSRLDGPSFESARQLVMSALAGETHGLLGRYYVDLKGPHPMGDEWLESVLTQLQGLGFDGDADRGLGTFGAAARFDAPVLYFGWYAGDLNGPFAAADFSFPPGAVALHIHSSSAATLHSTAQGWCGPFIARGVAATVGNVFEPYLEFTHRPNLLLRALSRGMNFGDAAYYALPVLSWQAVTIGDPLYRPFRVSLEQQERSAATLPPALAPYAVLRRANLLLRQNDRPAALAALQAGMRSQPGIVLGLSLAKVQLAAGDAKAAVGTLGFAAEMKQFRPPDWPLAREIAGLLAAHDARAAALKVYAALARAKAPTPEAQKALLAEARATADAAGDLTLSLDFGRQLSALTPVAPAPETPK